MINQIDLRDKVLDFDLIEKQIKNGDRNLFIVNSVTAKNELERKLSASKSIYKTTSMNNDYYIEIINAQKDKKSSYVVVIDKLYMGGNDQDLGQALLKSFIYTLTDVNESPTHILLYNEGVKLTTKTSEVYEQLSILEEKGVEILCCGSCVKYFELVDEVAVGRISNMLEILTSQINASKIIKP